MTQVLPENEEAQRAWDGVLFERFLRFRHLIVALAQHGEVAMRRSFLPSGETLRSSEFAQSTGCGLVFFGVGASAGPPSSSVLALASASSGDAGTAVAFSTSLMPLVTPSSMSALAKSSGTVVDGTTRVSSGFGGGSGSCPA